LLTGTSESCSAALLLFGRCIDPLNFDPVAHVLDEENLASFRSKTGLLYHIDPRNLTGRYYLQLEHPFEYIMAIRLRDASLWEVSSQYSPPFPPHKHHPRGDFESANSRKLYVCHPNFS
jgi:hypothetical protein